MNKYKAGDKLYFRANQRHCRSEEVTINKVGRKWLELSNRTRVDIKTLKADGGVFLSPGRCYPSEADYLAHLERTQEWNRLKFQIRDVSEPPAHLTTTDIQRIAKELSAQR